MEEALFNQAIQESLNNSRPSTLSQGGVIGQSLDSVNDGSLPKYVLEHQHASANASQSLF